MSMIALRPITVFAAATLVVTTACTRGDIVLGERGGLLTPTGGTTSSAAVGGNAGEHGKDIATGTAGRRTPVAGAAASGSAGSGSTSGQGDAGRAGVTPQAGAMAQAGAGGAVAGAGAPPIAHPSSGCGRAPLESSTIQVAGMTASYIVDLPASYDPARPYPLIMAYRDAGTTADSFRASLQLTPVIGEDAIAVYPNCLNDASSWELQRDVMLFDSLLVKLEAGYCIDKDRIFALGHGSGAVFTSLVGCVRSDQLRGIAPLSGSPPPPGPCVGPTAVWMLQGNADSANLGPARGNRDSWASVNGCDRTTTMPVDPPPCVEFAACAMGFPVRYCEYDGDSTLPSFAVSGAWSFFQGL